VQVGQKGFQLLFISSPTDDLFSKAFCTHIFYCGELEMTQLLNISLHFIASLHHHFSQNVPMKKNENWLVFGGNI